MKAQILIIVLVLTVIACNNEANEQTTHTEPIKLRIAAYNVEVSRNATAQEIGESLKKYNLDIIGFSETPGGNWTNDVAAVLGMQFAAVGQYSTAGHEDKYKSIASKTPLYDIEEFLMTDTLHTVTKAKTMINDTEIAIYSVHFPFGWRDQAHIDETTAKISSFVEYLEDRQQDEISIVVGDFNFIPSNKDSLNMYHEMFIEAGLDLSWKDLGIDVTRENTHNAFEAEDEGNGNVIDHIMYNPEKAEAVDGSVIEMDRPLSDHKPVWAFLQIKPE